MLTENEWLAKKVGVMSKQRRIRQVLTAPAAARVLASGLRQGGERQKRSTYSTEDGSPPELGAEWQGQQVLYLTPRQ